MAILERGDAIYVDWSPGAGAGEYSDFRSTLRELARKVAREATAAGAPVGVYSAASPLNNGGGRFRLAACDTTRTRDVRAHIPESYTADGITLHLDRVRAPYGSFSESQLLAALTCQGDHGPTVEPGLGGDEDEGGTPPDENPDEDPGGDSDPEPDEDPDVTPAGLDFGALPWWLWVLSIAAAVHYVTRRP